MNQINSIIDSCLEEVILQQVLDEEKNVIPIEDFSSMCIEAMYIIDFQKRCFHHVPCHNLFLCGRSREEVMQLGFDFYTETVHEKDYPLLLKIFHAILNYLKEDQDKQKNVNYFSFALRLKSPPLQIYKTNYLMVYHKLKPVFTSGILHFGICMLSCSVIPKSGNLRVYFKDSPDSNKYSFDSEKWKNRQDERLTEQEILILWLSKQKICNKQIADQLYISYDRLRHIKTQLFKKLKVKTMGHAIIYATNHLMLFVPNAKVFNVNICEKQYNKLTSDRLSRIQIRLDNNQSINSIAKDEDVSEGAIRKAIKNGKLIKNWK